MKKHVVRGKSYGRRQPTGHADTGRLLKGAGLTGPGVEYGHRGVG